MGGWVWQPVADRLRRAGSDVHTPTLSGLRAGDDHTKARLEDHVNEVVDLLDRADLKDVTLVGHSYSGLVVGQVTDRLRERIRHTVFVQAFLPRHGRSLIDDWSADPAARAAEIEDIDAHGGVWPAPIEGLRWEPDLSPSQRQWLADRFVDHPGRTVTDPAIMGRPVETIPATFIVSTPDDAEPLPDSIAGLDAEPTWTVLRMRAGHWPMVSFPDQLAELLLAAAPTRRPR